MRSLLLLPALLLLSTPLCAQGYALEEAFPGLVFTNPVDLQDAPDASSDLYVVEQRGRVVRFSPDSLTNGIRPFIDITDRVRFGGEQGLLGLAFDPAYDSNGYFYLHYGSALRSVISRFSVDSLDRTRGDKDSELILLDIVQTGEGNHKGGQIAFGPDGYLYIALGDGGSGGDPWNNAQRRDTLLGKLLRIDVHTQSSGRNYAIPPDNPFAGNTAGYREEIFAYGLRNPWRFSFDRATGTLWLADVGQGEWEEVDTITAGGNYGWVIMEGNDCYRPRVGCDTARLVMPLWTYPHDNSGGVSITGGYVYRGSRLQSLVGEYVYSDLQSGNVWALRADEGGVANRLLMNSGLIVSTFGVDAAGELYIVGYFDGTIYRFVEVAAAPAFTPAVARFEIIGSAADQSAAVTLPRRAHVRLRLHDLRGVTQATLVDGILEAGDHRLLLPVDALPPGLYYCTIESEGARQGRPVVVVR